MNGLGTTSSLRRRVRRTDSSGSERTFYALAESTRVAWERVKSLYSSDPDTRTADMSDVKQGYRFIDPLASETTIFVITSLFMFFLMCQLYLSRKQLIELLQNLEFHSVEVIIVMILLLTVQVAYRLHKVRPVFLLDFVTYKAPERLATSTEHFLELSERAGVFNQDQLAFQRKLLERSGLGEKTSFPDAMHRADEIKNANGNGHVVLNMHNARMEAEQVIFGVLDELFAKNNIDPKVDIDILIVNCSLFNPTPSLSAMVVNKYKMKQSIRTYNLAGMGCSAGLIAVDLCKDLFQAHKNVRCVIVSTENITQNWYLGKEKSMLISNTLFRLGGAGILLSNRGADRRLARFQLMHTVRTHSGAVDLAYDSIFQMEDKEGIRGVKLSKNIMDVAGNALKSNVTTLAPLVFPFAVHIKFGLYVLKKKVLKMKSIPPFVPDFHRAFKFFCIHTGGRGVLDVLEDALKLTQDDLKPSRFVLERFGNVSSASVWYELEYVEKCGKLQRGDRIWQIAFGSGFKCNSAVWKSLYTQNIPQSLDY